MNSQERRKLERELANKNAHQSSYDPNKWKAGSTTYTICNNSMSSNTGSKTYGYKNSNDRLNK